MLPASIEHCTAGPLLFTICHGNHLARGLDQYVCNSLAEENMKWGWGQYVCHSLAVEKVFRLRFGSAPSRGDGPQQFRSALLEGPTLRPCRTALADAVYEYVLPQGAFGRKSGVAGGRRGFARGAAAQSPAPGCSVLRAEVAWREVEKEK